MVSPLHQLEVHFAHQHADFAQKVNGLLMPENFVLAGMILVGEWTDFVHSCFDWRSLLLLS